MVSILHITQGLSRGGASRCLIGTARLGLDRYRHAIVPLNPSETDPQVAAYAREQGIEVLEGLSREDLLLRIESADIVQINWWNTPEMDDFLRSSLPPTRLIVWGHVGGDSPPQVITDEILMFSDRFVGASPYTLRCQAISRMSDELRRKKTRMMYGAADFSRLAGLTPVPHQGFNIGYIGTIDFVKMHPKFVEMSASVKVDEVKYLVCGHGHIELLRQQAQALGQESKFEFLGYVEDVRSVIQILDVFGYPLTPDTYAASELTLQEVMYSGIPPVVFGAGGIRDLVINDFTGIVVRDEVEYAQAIEHLYHTPEERKRLGENARNYAEQIFRIERSSDRFIQLYDEVMSEPKRLRVWGKESSLKLVDQELKIEDILDVDPAFQGCQRFIESLGDHGEIFRRSLSQEGISSKEWAAVIEADSTIYGASTLVRNLGLGWYSRYYPNDRYLKFWLGLATLGGSSQNDVAAHALAESLQMGIPLWRVGVHLAKALIGCNNGPTARELLQQVLMQVPECRPARELLEWGA